MNKLKSFFVLLLFAGCASVSILELKKTDYIKALGNKKSLHTAYATPVFDKNKNIRGFRIQSFEDKSPLLIFGLIPGDVITNINGEDLTSLVGAQKLLLQAPDFSVLSVTFEREGKEYTYRYKVVN